MCLSSQKTDLEEVGLEQVSKIEVVVQNNLILSEGQWSLASSRFASSLQGEMPSLLLQKIQNLSYRRAVANAKAEYITIYDLKHYYSKLTPQSPDAR